ncbi:hypothetical protein SUDANB23_03962 [Streptomyces sp. enrichment culture]
MPHAQPRLGLTPGVRKGRNPLPGCGPSVRRGRRQDFAPATTTLAAQDTFASLPEHCSKSLTS